MKKAECTNLIIQAKKQKNLSWEAIAAGVGKSPAWVTSACLGMNSMPAELADRLCTVLDLPSEVSASLQECPNKTWAQTIPTDPLLYRFYEMINVYGPTIKELIHEKFGDGIMSAIDFSMDLEKVPDPKGDRVRITLNGKFLPYKVF